jgi:hypothetical protein
VHVLIGWPPPVPYGHELATRVMNLCGTLRRRGLLEGVLATLPPADAERSRARVFALLQSLVSSGVGSAGVLLSLTTLQASDLEECLSAGILDYVFLEESATAHGALGVLGASRLPREAAARVRVWVTDASQGAYQKHMAAWVSAFDFAGELAPAPFSLADGAPAAPAGPATAPPALALVGCEWRKSVITVTGDGSVLPCPAHLPLGGPTVSASDPDLVLARLAEWHGSLDTSALCARCDRPVRFGIQDWLGSRQVQAPASPEGERKYHDYVGRDASEATEEELDHLLEELGRRIDRCAEPGDLP